MHQLKSFLFDFSFLKGIIPWKTMNIIARSFYLNYESENPWLFLLLFLDFNYSYINEWQPKEKGTNRDASTLGRRKAILLLAFA